MPKPYPPDAVEFCLSLYLKYNGEQFDRIQAEMRQRYPGWCKTNLFDYGGRHGWITKYNWEHALRLKLQATAQAALTSAETLYLDIKNQREALSLKITKGAATNFELGLHRDYCKLEMEAMVKLQENRSRMQDFAVFWEYLLGVLNKIDKPAWRTLLGVSDDVLKFVQEEYGKETT